MCFRLVDGLWICMKWVWWDVVEMGLVVVLGFLLKGKGI